MNKKTKEKVVYNKLVGRIGDSFYFCDYIFRHEDGFKGATGTVLEPVSNSEYEDRMDSSNSDTLEYFKEVWQQAVQNDSTEANLEDWVEDVLNIDGEEAIWDLSGYAFHDQIREAEPEYTKDDYPLFSCSGGGRCFDANMKFDKIYDKELWKKIQAIEK